MNGLWLALFASLALLFVLLFASGWGGGEMRQRISTIITISAFGFTIYNSTRLEIIKMNKNSFPHCAVQARDLTLTLSLIYLQHSCI